MFKFYHKRDGLTLHFQRFKGGQGTMPEPRWRCWLVANNKKEVAFNHYPQKSPNESAVELLNFVDIEKYYPVCDMPFYRLEGAEEEHF